MTECKHEFLLIATSEQVAHHCLHCGLPAEDYIVFLQARIAEMDWHSPTEKPSKMDVLVLKTVADDIWIGQYSGGKFWAEDDMAMIPVPKNELKGWKYAG